MSVRSSSSNMWTCAGHGQRRTANCGKRPVLLRRPLSVEGIQLEALTMVGRGSSCSFSWSAIIAHYHHFDTAGLHAGAQIRLTNQPSKIVKYDGFPVKDRGGEITARKLMICRAMGILYPDQATIMGKFEATLLHVLFPRRRKEVEKRSKNFHPNFA